jgi:hypothetical protein
MGISRNRTKPVPIRTRAGIKARLSLQARTMNALIDAIRRSMRAPVK